jgi:hypothetical protein
MPRRFRSSSLDAARDAVARAARQALRLQEIRRWEEEWRIAREDRLYGARLESISMPAHHAYA